MIFHKTEYAVITRPNNRVLGIDSKELEAGVPPTSRTQTFAAASFIVAQTQKQTRSFGKCRLRKLGSVQTAAWHSALKRNALSSRETARRTRECPSRRGRSPSERLRPA